MKPPVSPEAHQQVLELRRGHSLREVADQTGLPLGTVKTICSRSGAFRDNLALRALLTLPPVQASNTTALTVPELPPQQSITGDKDLDAVLWLRSVIQTGQAALIERAMQAAKLVKTPLKELEKRYMNHLVSTNPGNMFAAMSSFGFADLDDLAKRSIEKLTRQTEAHARFGEDVFANTPAEQFCIEAVKGLKRNKNFGDYDDAQVDQRFKARPDLLPHTLSDCLYELAYWNDLYLLRNAVSLHAGDPVPEAYAREQFTFRCLGRIRASSKTEAVAVFRYLADSEYMDRTETEGILLNLIGKTPKA